MPSISPDRDINRDRDRDRTPSKLGVGMFTAENNPSLAIRADKNASSILGKPDQMPTAIPKGKSLEEIKRDLRTGDKKIMNLIGIGND